jgi:tetratricopeptide (TPR) repeat protein
MSRLRLPATSLLLALVLVAGRPRVGWAQGTTTSPPSAPATPEPSELRPAAKDAPRAKLAQAPDSVALREHLRKAAALQAKFKDSEALAAYEAALKISPQHYGSLWRAAVLSVSIGNRYSDETRKSAYFAAAHQYANRALVLRPDAGESNYAMALALFSEAGLLSARSRLRIFKQLRPHVFLAAERRPDMPEAWQLLGRWYYRVAHYNVLEKVFSRVVLGGYPQGASSKKAMEAMEKAHELDPTRIQYSYDLARMYKYQGRRRLAIAVLQAAIKLPTYTSEDLTINRLCQQLLPPLVRAASRRDRMHARWYERLRTGSDEPAAREGK